MSMSTVKRTDLHISEDGVTESHQHRTENDKKCCLTS